MEQQTYTAMQRAKIGLVVPISRAVSFASLRPKTLVILGMHRSGTSMIANMLHHMGVHMGDQLIGAADSNPLGHYEDIDFVGLNDQILEQAGGSWQEPPSESEILEQEEVFSLKIASLLQAKQLGRHWGWKDPRSVITFKLFRPYLNNTAYIICHRSELDIARSLEKRDGIEFKQAIELAREYNRRLKDLLQDIPSRRQLHLAYERVRQKPLTSIARLAFFCNVPLTQELVAHTRGIILRPAQLEQVKEEFKRRPEIAA